MIGTSNILVILVIGIQDLYTSKYKYTIIIIIYLVPCSLAHNTITLIIN